jgi:Ion channel
MIAGMDWVLVLGGTALIALGLLDVLLTVLHYDDLGFLSNRLHRGVWTVVRWVTRPLPRKSRNFGLSLGAPLMIPVTILFWAGIEILGFASVYYAGMGEENFAFDNDVEPDFGAALYLSGVTLATLGYGDITPISPLYEGLALGEALIGFAILSLSISYQRVEKVVIGPEDNPKPHPNT